MRIKSIKSEIISLPNFNGSWANEGGINGIQYIHWHKTDEDGNYLGFTDNEALDLLNKLNKLCSGNVKNSNIQEDEKENIDLSAYGVSPTEYSLSKLYDYSQDFNFEINGYVPNTFNK